MLIVIVSPVNSWLAQCQLVREVSPQTSSCPAFVSDEEHHLDGTKALCINIISIIIRVIIIIIMDL